MFPQTRNDHASLDTEPFYPRDFPSRFFLTGVSQGLHKILRRADHSGGELVETSERHARRSEMTRLDLLDQIITALCVTFMGLTLLKAGFAVAITLARVLF